MAKYAQQSSDRQQSQPARRFLVRANAQVHMACICTPKIVNVLHSHLGGKLKTTVNERTCYLMYICMCIIYVGHIHCGPEHATPRL